MEESNFSKFKVILLASSNTNDYKEAIKEWNIVCVYQEDSSCICGKAIINCCKILNKENNKQLIVGSICVKKFLGIDTTLEFKQLKTRSKYTYRYIETLHGKNKINDWEATFLVSLIKFKTLSVKQRLSFNKIDKKIKNPYN